MSILLFVVLLVSIVGGVYVQRSRSLWTPLVFITLFIPLGLIYLWLAGRGSRESRKLATWVGIALSPVYALPQAIAVTPVVFAAIALWLGGAVTLVFGLINLKAHAPAARAETEWLDLQLQWLELSNAEVVVDVAGRQALGIDAEGQTLYAFDSERAFPRRAPVTYLIDVRIVDAGAEAPAIAAGYTTELRLEARTSTTLYSLVLLRGKARRKGSAYQMALAEGTRFCARVRGAMQAAQLDERSREAAGETITHAFDIRK